MLINVPQYIDVEDKVAGPLTLKQLGWMLAMGIILLILWNVFSGIVFFCDCLANCAFVFGADFLQALWSTLGKFCDFCFFVLF